jgi:hypothetical protein
VHHISAISYLESRNSGTKAVHRHGVLLAVIFGLAAELLFPSAQLNEFKDFLTSWHTSCDALVRNRPPAVSDWPHST